ncbi:unnamed protein product, partial [Tetraodon nigroviridis]
DGCLGYALSGGAPQRTGGAAAPNHARTGKCGSPRSEAEVGVVVTDMTESGAQLFARLDARRCLKDVEPRLFPEHGGPDHGDVVELHGPAGTGKTELLYHLLCRCVMPAAAGGLEVEVMFVDTDYSLDMLRLVSILDRRLTGSPGSPSTEASLRSCLSRLLVVHCSSSSQLLLTLHLLETSLSSRPGLALLLIDSISAFYWLDRSEGGASIAKQEEKLSKCSHLLARLLRDYRITVFATCHAIRRNHAGPSASSEVKNHRMDGNNPHTSEDSADPTVAVRSPGNWVSVCLLLGAGVGAGSSQKTRSCLNPRRQDLPNPESELAPEPGQDHLKPERELDPEPSEDLKESRLENEHSKDHLVVQSGPAEDRLCPESGWNHGTSQPSPAPDQEPSEDHNFGSDLLVPEPDPSSDPALCGSQEASDPAPFLQPSSLDLSPVPMESGCDPAAVSTETEGVGSSPTEQSPTFSPLASPCLRLDDEDSLSPLFHQTGSEDCGGSGPAVLVHSTKLCSSPEQLTESSSEFVEQLGPVGLPHDLSIQSLFDPTGVSTQIVPLAGRERAERDLKIISAPPAGLRRNNQNLTALHPHQRSAFHCQQMQTTQTSPPFMSQPRRSLRSCHSIP